MALLPGNAKEKQWFENFLYQNIANASNNIVTKVQKCELQ